MTHNLCFEQKYEKYQNFYMKIFIFFLVVKFSIYLNRRVFLMIVFDTYPLGKIDIGTFNIESGTLPAIVQLRRKMQL